MIKGARTLQRRLIRIARLIPKLAAIELDNQAETLRGRAIAVAPELTRKLILSSRVGSRDTGSRIERSVSFDTEYAVVRHEDFYQPGPITAAKAATQDGPAGRKYLERPFQNMIAEVQAELGKIPLAAARRATSEVRGDD